MPVEGILCLRLPLWGTGGGEYYLGELGDVLCGIDYWYSFGSAGILIERVWLWYSFTA